jgi:general stress protein CsbA
VLAYVVACIVPHICIIFYVKIFYKKYVSLSLSFLGTGFFTTSAKGTSAGVWF